MRPLEYMESLGWVGEDVWYAVILPKLNKTGYIISSQADVTEKGAR